MREAMLYKVKTLWQVRKNLLGVVKSFLKTNQRLLSVTMWDLVNSVQTIAKHDQRTVIQISKIVAKAITFRWTKIHKRNYMSLLENHYSQQVGTHGLKIVEHGQKVFIHRKLLIMIWRLLSMVKELLFTGNCYSWSESSYTSESCGTSSESEELWYKV